MHRAILCLILPVLAAASGCGQQKTYLRHPLVRDMNVTAGPVSEPERSTQAEPYPPPRPYLPTPPANVVKTGQ